MVPTRAPRPHSADAAIRASRERETANASPHVAKFEEDRLITEFDKQRCSRMSDCHRGEALAAPCDTLTKDIEANKKVIAETQAEMKKASEIREGENADFQQTVLDQRITQAILQKAIDRMSQVYGFLQKPGAPHIQTSGTHTDPGNGPAKFTKYEENAGGKRVIAMLDTVMADSKKMENDAIRSEQDAAASYEMFMKDSNKSIAQMLRANVNMSEEKAKSEEAISRDEKDLKATMKTLESLNEELGDLHRSCDFVLKNFDARQKARGLEIDALREAKAILSGMK